MKHLSSILVIGIASLALSCGDDKNSKSDNSINNKSSQESHSQPNKIMHSDIDNGTITSPTSTPLNMVQEFVYADSEGNQLKVKYTFDDLGNGIAILDLPNSGEIIALQDGEAVAKNMNYRSENGLMWHVTHDNAELIQNDVKTQYTIVK